MIALELLCPHCEHLETRDDEEAPEPNMPQICAKCGQVGVTVDGGDLRKPTDEELAELINDPEFGSLLHFAQHVTELLSAVESGGSGMALVMSDEGVSLANGEPAPPFLAELAAAALKKFKVEQMGRQIRRYVTQEVANHILSSYGDERASMPNITTAALISLIRLAKESDEEMVLNLLDVEDFRGYVLGVTSLAEHPPEGIDMLKMLAGFIDPDGVER